MLSNNDFHTISACKQHLRVAKMKTHIPLSLGNIRIPKVGRWSDHGLLVTSQGALTFVPQGLERQTQQMLETLRKSEGDKHDLLQTMS